ncbi:MAG: SLC13 family permease [Pirellulales bacterium]
MSSDEITGHDPLHVAVAWVGRLGGPVLAAVVVWLLARHAPGLGWEGRVTAAVVVLMAVWWMTEAIPLPVTSLLPIGLSVIAMMAGQNHGHGVPTSDSGIVGEGSADGLPHDDLTRLAPCLLLGIAYAANIGGVGTLVGTPPNVLLAGFVKTQYAIEIGFGRWMLFGIPLVAIFILIAWWILTRIVFRIRGWRIAGSTDLIREELKRLGPMRRGERIVLIVFVGTAVAWAVREPLTAWSGLAATWPAARNINDTTIALAAAILLFLIPVDLRRGVFALDWETAQRLPWGVLLLFGGGLSLAKAVSTSGLATWIGDQMSAFSAWPLAAIVVVTTVLVILLTEVTSNTATTTTFLPILGGVATGIGAPPLLLLVPAALAASFAFMLPVATPPNALVFGSGQITMGQMIRAGMWLNVVGAVLIPLLLYTVGQSVLPLGP